MTAAAARAIRPPSKALMLLEGRLVYEFGAFLAALPLLRFAPRGDGHPVIVFPGLVTSDLSTHPLRTFLQDQGYKVSGWKLGRNYGLREGIQDGMVDLVDDVFAREGQPVSLVGWSLGGIYARQLAKMMVGKVRSVITLGSPFASDPRATNAWRIYEMASGRKADESADDFGGTIAAPPPVPTTAIFSRTDGICAWQGCIEKPAAQAENIEVLGSHCGLGHHPAAVYAIADRLAQPAGKWKPFDRTGWRAMVYPDPAR